MRAWTKTAGVLLLAAAAVYSDQVALAIAASKASKAKVAAPPVPQVAPIEAPAAPTTVPVASAPDAFPEAPPAPEGSGDSPQVNVSDAGTVEIHVNDASVVEVLRMLSLQSQRNIITSKEVRGNVTANLFDVTTKEALDAILSANGYGYREKGNFIYVYSAKEIAEIEKSERKQNTEIFRLYYTPAANLVTMIKPVLSPEAQVSFTTPALSGIESDGKDVGGNSHATEDLIIVTDYADHLDQVRKIIREVDRRPQQILVEAVILRATIQEDNDLGVDFTALGGVDFSTLSGISSAGSGSGLSQALSGQITQNAAGNTLVEKGFAAGQVGGGGLKLGLVSNNVGLFINALEGITDTVVMANPKVLVLNKQKGEVHVGSEQGYRTAVATETLTADDVKFLETGTRLIFRPFIGDNGFVRMEIKPEDSSGSVNAAGLPNKFVTQVTTNVMVRDGHTIVIGGLFRESTDMTRSGVPVLQNLPGVGPIFRRQSDSTVREEVIILLTPHIIKDETAYAAASEQEMKHAEQVRVGARRGLMPWGRERLAETSYEQAVAEMAKAKPNHGKAKWYLDLATNLNPKFSEAIQLKEKVTGEQISSVDNSSIRDFVRRQILAERAGQTPASQPAAPLELGAAPSGVKKEKAAPTSEAALPNKAAVAP